MGHSQQGIGGGELAALVGQTSVFFDFTDRHSWQGYRGQGRGDGEGESGLSRGDGEGESGLRVLIHSRPAKSRGKG